LTVIEASLSEVDRLTALKLGWAVGWHGPTPTMG
jgi:hypothetical protein